jgi:TonB-linked SusC/RagA family outer membrane protein
MVQKLDQKIFLLFYLLGFIAMLASAQVTFKGNIRDENNMPLPGVTIVEKGTNNGCTTNLDGNFTLDVNENAVLVVSYVGYLTEEVDTKGRTEIKLQLVPDIIALGDVVVIGYGSVKRSDLTGAVASVKSEDISKLPVTRVEEALQGKAAGVMVLQNSGQPGNAPVIRVRGLATVNGGSPLVVVDGVVGGSLGDINPNDIESIEVLKDAASQAIYGSAGGNGVILVSTKKGKTGSMQSNFDMYFGTQKVIHTVDVANAQEYAAIYNQYREAAEQPTYFLYDNATKKYLSPTDTLPLTNTNWFDEIFRKAVMKNIFFSANGGSEKSNYYFSVGYSTQEGTLRRTYDDRYTLRLNSDHKLTNRLRVGQNLSILRNIFATQDERNEYNSPVSTAMQMLPFVPVYATDNSGNYAYKGAGLACNIKNPVAQIAYNNNKTVANSLFGDIYANVDIIKGLSFESRLGFNYFASEYSRFTPDHIIGSVNDASASQSIAINQYQQINNNNYGWQWQNFLTYKKTLFEKHNITLMVGSEAGYSRLSNEDITLTNLFNNSEPMRNLQGGAPTVTQLLGRPTEISGYAYFGRINYDYAGIFLLQANFRNDNSSKIGPNDRSDFFPSVSAGLKFSEFNFIKNTNLISFGKIRIGYGETGNSDIQPFLYINSIGSLPIHGYPFGGITQDGAALLTAANPDLKWETVITQNLGIDLGLLNNRLNFSFDLFKRRNKDMLIRKSVPLTVGYMVTGPTQELGDPNLDTRPMVNYGTLNNKGFETVIGYKSKIGKLGFDVNLNITHAVTKIDDIGDPLYEGEGRGLANVCQTKNGEVVSAFVGYQTDGIFKESDFTWYKDKTGRWKRVVVDPRGTNIIEGFDLNGNPVQYKVLQTNVKPGDFKFVDVNNDGVINAFDRVRIGDPNPKFTYGLSINLEYGNFDLNAFLQGSYGNDIFNMLKVNMYTMNNGGLNVSPELIDAYIPAVYNASDPNTLPAVISPARNEDTGKPRMDPNLSSSDFYVENGSYMRLKNIQLGYTLPASMTEKIKINKLRLYIGAKNLFTITKYTGFDPEVNETTILERGFDRGTYPQSRMYLIGINLMF